MRWLECVRVSLGDAMLPGGLRRRSMPGRSSCIAADQIIKAIGQQKPSVAALLGLKTTKGFIAVDLHFETSVPGIYAGGDCIRARGAASTVMAVQDGKLAAQTIRRKAHERTWLI